MVNPDNQEIRGILFDKDGTLLDFNGTWLPPYLAAAELLAAESGGRIDASGLMRAGGYQEESNSWATDSLLAAGSNQQILDAWSALIGRPVDGQLKTRLGELFRREGSDYVAVIPGLRTCLQQLRKAGYILGLATMDDEHHAHKMLEALELADLMSFVCGADSGYGVKPEPGMVLAFCKQTGLDPGQVAMVGDSPRDINMGLNAGAGHSIGVASGAHSHEELARFTDIVLDDVGGLEAWLAAG